MSGLGKKKSKTVWLVIQVFTMNMHPGIWYFQNFHGLVDLVYWYFPFRTLLQSKRRLKQFFESFNFWNLMLDNTGSKTNFIENILPDTPRKTYYSDKSRTENMASSGKSRKFKGLKSICNGGHFRWNYPWITIHLEVSLSVKYSKFRKRKV